MRIKVLGAASLVIGSLLSLSPSVAWSQSTASGKFTIAADAGTRLFIWKPDSLELGKFEEYRDLPGNTFVPERLLLNYTPGSALKTLTLDGRKLFERDASVWFQARQLGKYDLQVRWDRVPHTYSTTARSPGLDNGSSFNTLPAPRPDSMAWRNAPYIGAVRQQWDPIKGSIVLTPNEKLDTKIDYMHLAKSGGMPLSLSFNASSGPQREFIAPIDQTTQDFKLTQSFVSGLRSEKSFLKSYQLLASYDYSQFRNGVKSVMVDNPQLSVPTFNAGAATARASMAPDNAAQTAALTAAIMLPARTRVTATATRSWMTQNDQFLPQTANDSMARDPNFGLLALPRTSLDGKVQTSVLNLSVNTHPIENLTVAAKYRTFDRKDNTAIFHIRAMAISDRSIALGDSLYSELDPFTKANTDVSASYQLMRALSVTGGYSTENWTREADVRNLAKTKEKGPRASVDFNGLNWLSLHASYVTTQRRGDNYVEAGTEIIGFRRFDLSDRDRTRTTVMATLTPFTTLNVSLNYGKGDDKFPNSQYGTQSDKATSKGIDADWTFRNRITIGGGWSRDDAENVLNSRYRTGAVGTVTYDNPTYKWTNTNTDQNTTTYASLNATVIPNKVELFASFSNIDGHFWVYNVNPQAPTGGTATQNLAATVENWPEVTQTLRPIAVSLRYLYSNDWAISAGFHSEQYDQTDFRTGMPLFAPFNGANGNLPASVGTVAGFNSGQYHFLSNAYQPYTANWFTVTVSYHPSELPFRKARMTL